MDDTPLRDDRGAKEMLRPMADRQWPQIKPLTFADQVYEALRDRILEGELSPGEFIREQEVSEAMGVSRTPVREALGRLASEGFLERIPHRGFRIPEEPLREVLDVYPIVSALEVLCGRLALPRLEPADIERLKAINAKLAKGAEQKGRKRNRKHARELVELNNQFHRVFWERCGNRRLLELLEDLRSQILRLELWYYSYPEHTAQSVREHDQIIRAIEAGDHEEALRVLERNMALTSTMLAEETGKLEAIAFLGAGVSA
ncbi:MAG: GntR family transcriptional regulator [bacterium]